MSDLLLDHLRRALGDTFSIERELTGGGMSRVFVARERALGREVVIKVLPKELALGVNRERFRQEVQLAARLSHPYIVTLLHAGEHEDLLWFTMPFISGESLKARLEKSGPLTVRETVQYGRDVLEALAYAHAQGVIHRDIKPANILVDGGHALVTDFGVAKALSAAMPALGGGHTTTGMAIGTPAYMAPEQLAADPNADHRVDIYAMGLLMYELLAGASPFSTPSPTATMAAQLTRMPDPLDKVRADVPPALAALITHCLAKNPDERPVSAQAILDGLDRISGELAAAAHQSRASRIVQKLVPAAAALVLVAVAATAAAMYVQRNKVPDTPVVQTPPTPAPGGDAPQTVALTPEDVKPKTAEEVRDKVEALYAELERLDPTFRASQQRPAAVSDAGQLARLDSLVNARVDARLQKSQELAPRPVQEATPLRGGPPPGSGMERRGPEPRKLVVETGAFAGRGLPDSMLRVLSEQVGRELTQRMGGNWTIVRREQIRGANPDPLKDTAIAGADALVSVTLAPINRQNPDSVVLRMTVTNTGDRRSEVLTSGSVYKPNTAAAFQGTIDKARGLIFSIDPSRAGTWVIPNRAMFDSMDRMFRNGLGGGRRGGGGPDRDFPGDSARRARGGGPAAAEMEQAMRVADSLRRARAGGGAGGRDSVTRVGGNRE